jgi:hypothetical protein
MKKILAAAAIVGAALAAAASAAAPTLTLAASAPSVVYGKPVTLSGVLSTQQANQKITVQEMACGKTTFARAGNAKTTTGGKYSLAQTPVVNTVYQAKWKSTTSSKVTVSVKPLLQLTKVARGSYTAKVTAGLDLKGKVILFQRYSKTKHRWVQVKKVTLTTSTAGPSKPTVIASASFKAKVRLHPRVRVAISKAQAAPCYIAAASKSLRA